jgi:hypothetical protein
MILAFVTFKIFLPEVMVFAIWDPRRSVFMICNASGRAFAFEEIFGANQAQLGPIPTPSAMVTPRLAVTQI